MTIVSAVRVNPFPGLRPFQSEEEHLFFGRETQIDELLGRLRRTRFLAVVGTSGSGKSSLVRAGMLPSLNGGLMAGAGSRWRIALLRPGNEPLANLARALTESAALGDPTSAEDLDAQLHVSLTQATLARGALGLVEAVQQARLDPDENVLVVVDQFEEIFRFKGSGSELQHADEAAAFVKLLLAAASHPTQSIYIVLTMRSDFLGDCEQFRDLPETINEGLFLVPRMTRTQLRSAIEGPIGVAGGRIAPRLVTRLLNDLGDDPDQLPVLQHALMRTWNLWEADHETGEPIDLRHYEATGGLGQALSLHADEIYAALADDRSREVAERLFKCLTDTGSDKRGVRRPRRFHDACAIVGASAEEVRSVVEAFRAADCSFLMPPAGTPLEDDTVLDISHESLMRVWKRLQQWVDEEAQSAQIYRRLAESAALHARGEAGLMRDPELSIALRWREETHPNAAWAERYNPSFVDAMRFLESSRDAREKEASDRARARRREVRNWRFFALILMACLGVMVVAVVLAVTKTRAATDERNHALEVQSRFLARDSRAAVDQGNAVTGMLLALEALPKDLSRPDRPYVIEGEYALEDAFANQRERIDFRRDKHAVVSASFSRDGKRIVSASNGGTIRIWDAMSGYLIRAFPGTTAGYLYSATFSPNGKRIAAASDKTVRVWDAMGRKQFFAKSFAKSGLVNSVAYSHDGQSIVSAWADKSVRVLNALNGRLIMQLPGHQDNVWSAAFSLNGKRIVSSSADQSVRIWDVNTHTQTAVLTGHGGQVWSAVFSPDGSRIASATDDRAIRLWDTANGRPAILPGHDNSVLSVSFSPDGKRIVSSSRDKTVREWDVKTGAEIAVLRGHDGYVWSAAFSPDPEGKWIISASADGSVRRWSSAVPSEHAVLRGHKGQVNSAAFSPDGKQIVSASDDGTVRVWDTTRDVQTKILHGHGGRAKYASFSLDGKRIVGGFDDGAICVWDASGKEVAEVAPYARNGSPVNSVNSVFFSPDGKRIVSASNDKIVRLWNATNNQKPMELTGPTGPVNSAAFSIDGNRVVSAYDDGTLRLWNATNGSLIGKPLQGHEARVTFAAFAPDGKSVVSASDDQTLAVWDVTSGRQIHKFAGHDGYVKSAAFSSDGKRIVSASLDNTVRVWDASKDDEIIIVFRGHDSGVRSAAFSQDGNYIVSASSDNTVRVWQMPPRDQALINAARAALPRKLSDSQRKREFLDPP